MLYIFDTVSDTLLGLIADYGLAGLFLASLIGSAAFIPFANEVGFPILVKAGIMPWKIWLSATLGAYVGASINYWLGYKGGEYALRKSKEKDIENSRLLMDKYGFFGLTAVMMIPLPLPVDPLTLVCGAAKMGFSRFSAAIIIGKGIKYVFLLYLLSFLM